MAELRQNTWSLNAWYDQDVAGDAKYEAAGKLWMWGNNYYGQLGQNSTLPNPSGYSSPTQVGTDTTWTRIASYSDNKTYAMKQDGSLWTWGYNEKGQLGLNDVVARSSPTQLPGTGWQLTRDSFFGSAIVTQAIKTDGSMWIWGWNDSGELGLPRVAPYWYAMIDRSSPTQLPGTWTKAQVSSGLKNDGSLWMWGDNFYGTLGQNTSAFGSPVALGAASSPVQIPGDWKDFSRSAIPQGFCSGIKTDGTLWTWGKNDAGQAGNGTPGQPDYHQHWRLSSPVQVGGGSDWERCASYTYNKNVWQKTDGSIWFSGPGPTTQNYGLGGRSSPTQIPGTIIPGIDYILAGNATFSLDSATSKVYFNGPNSYGIMGTNQPAPSSSSTLTYLPDVWDKFKNTGITKNQLGMQHSGSVGAIEKT